MLKYPKWNKENNKEMTELTENIRLQLLFILNSKTFDYLFTWLRG